MSNVVFTFSCPSLSATKVAENPRSISGRAWSCRRDTYQQKEQETAEAIKQFNHRLVFIFSKAEGTIENLLLRRKRIIRPIFYNHYTKKILV